MTSATSRIASVLISGAIAAFAFTAPVFAAGGDDSGGATTPTCKKGEVYDKKTQKCVKQSGANITDDNRTEYAYSLAKAGRYDEALAMLDTLKDQNTAEALNYRGYATRKLGRTDEGIGYYLKSVQLDPQYAKVRKWRAQPRHVAQKCAAVLRHRHATKQRLKAWRANPKDRDTL